MKDKRTYTNKKEHGEDMSHENESKITDDLIHRGPLRFTEQYRTITLQKIKTESLYIKTENQLKGTKQIVIEMSNKTRIKNSK